MMQARPVAMAMPLIAATLAGCQSVPAETNNVAAMAIPPVPVPETPIEAAHRLVLARLAVGEGVAFQDEQLYTNAGATIVCGRYAQAGRPALRYIVVGEQDVFVESDFEGDIGAAAAETCRNG
jgi:hypothetical protein